MVITLYTYLELKKIAEALAEGNKSRKKGHKKGTHFSLWIWKVMV